MYKVQLGWVMTAPVALSTALAQRGAASLSWLSSIRRCHVELTHTCCLQAPASTSAGKQPLFRRNPTQQWITAAFVKTKVLLLVIYFPYFPCAQQMLWWEEQDNQKIPLPFQNATFPQARTPLQPRCFPLQAANPGNFSERSEHPKWSCTSSTAEFLDWLFSRQKWGFKREHCSKAPQTQLSPTVAAAAMAAHLPQKQELNVAVLCVIHQCHGMKMPTALLTCLPALPVSQRRRVQTAMVWLLTASVWGQLDCSEAWKCEQVFQVIYMCSPVDYQLFSASQFLE